MNHNKQVESLNLLIAMERAKERGVPRELTFFNEEDVAVQAVLSGEADVGVGAPYPFIQNSEAPIRTFYRMSTLLFFPVVNSEMYKGWEDLDGQEVAVQSRGSGTEALYAADGEAARHHLLQRLLRARLGGTRRRDAAGHDQRHDRRRRQLPAAAGAGRRQVRPPAGGGVNATDEALYARADFLEERAADVQVLVEELLRTWKDVADNPAIVGELREKYGLLPDLPAQALAEAVPYFEEAAANGVYPLDGGEPQNARDDIAFLAAAGQVEGDPSAIDPADYWDFTALEAAKAAN
jgi:NitT/TauT family transport system substrate-binding protein